MRAHDDMAAADHGQRPTPSQVAAAAEVLRMLADPTRLELMWALRDGESDVTALTAEVAASRSSASRSSVSRSSVSRSSVSRSSVSRSSVSRSSVSQHLGRLRLAGLVDVRRQGRRMIYQARGGHVRRLVREALFHADHDLGGGPVHD